VLADADHGKVSPVKGSEDFLRKSFGFENFNGGINCDLEESDVKRNKTVG